MRRAYRVWTVAALVVSAAGCVGQPRSADQPRSDRSLITREQFLETHYTNAYDVVEALHSNWLRTKGTDTFTKRDPTADSLRSPGPSRVLAYLDNTMLGGVDKLRDIALTSVSFIKYYDGRDATARWGLDHGMGVILVSTHDQMIDPPPATHPESLSKR